MQFSLSQAIQSNSLVLAATTPIQEAIAAMNRQQTSYVLVETDAQLVGIFTERDLVRAIAAETIEDQIPLSALMTSPLITRQVNDIHDIFSVLEIFQQQQIRHLPLLDEQGHLVGVVTPETLRQVLQPEHLLTSRRVGEVMTSAVVHAPPDLPLAQLTQRMAERQVSCVVIVEPVEPELSQSDPLETAWTGFATFNPLMLQTMPTAPARSATSTERWRPLGIITERDIVKLRALQVDFQQVRAADVMSAPVATVQASISLLQVHQQMQRQQIRCLVVTGESGELIGIVTQSDVLRVVNLVELHQVIESLQHLMLQQTEALQQQVGERQQLLRTLQTSKLRYQGMLNNLPDAVCCFEADGTITFANRACCQFLGQSVQSLLGRNFLELLPATAQMMLRQQLVTLQHTHGKVTYEHEVIRADGSLRWMSWTNCAICDEANELIEFQAIGQDITERKQAEETLRQSETRNRAILSAIPDLLLRVKRDGTCLDCIFPKDAGENLYMPVQSHIGEVLAPETLRRILSSVEQALATGELQVFEHQLVKFNQVHDEEVRVVSCGPDEALLIVRDITHRKQSETQLRRLTENVPGVVYRYVLHPDGTEQFPYISRRCHEVYEVEAEVFMKDARLIWNMIHPDDIPQMRERIVLSAEHMQPWFAEHRVIPPSGKLKWIQAVSRPERQANGDLVWDGLIVDITERKQVEIALRDSETRFRTIFEQAAVGITQATLNGDYIRVNQRFCDLVGYSEAELLQRNFIEITHPDDRQTNLHYTRQLIAGEIRAFSMEKRYLCKNGELRWVQLSGSLVLDELTQQHYLIGVIEDIQERKQAESEVQKQQAFLRNVIDIVPSAIFVKDRQGTIIIANHAAAAMYGVTVEELLGKRDHELNADAAQVEEFLRINQEVMTSRQRQVISSQTIRTQQGEFRTYRTTISPFTDAQGEVLGIIGSAVDITELKQAEEALRHSKDTAEAANHAKSQFLANMSHELRTPLNSILGFAQLLNADSTLTPEQREQLSIILRSGEHLLELINDVLEMSKIDAGRLSLNETGFNLYQLLNNLQDMLSFKAEAKGLQLIFNRTEDVPQYVRTDESKLRQVLLNLLSNAIKFTQVGRVMLQVSTKPISSTEAAAPTLSPSSPVILAFEVSDTGPGIAPSELSSLFNAFVQTEAGRRSQEGTGLGLAISRRFVELMGGTIGVRSAPGQGTTFWFEIVASPTEPEAAQPEWSGWIVGLAPDQPCYRILVAEDQLSNRMLVVRLLAQLGFEVLEAENGQEAITQWQERAPHLILMDMRMPQMDGYAATREIRRLQKTQEFAQFPEPKIIALTASAFEEERLQIFAAGCDACVAKPFKMDELLLTIANYLDIRYRYAHQAMDNSLAPKTATTTDSMPLRPEDLHLLPHPWRLQLYRAAAQLDAKRCVELIQQIPAKDADLIAPLLELVTNFRFDLLMELTQAATCEQTTEA
ncbi:MAG: PAS domain S-box protein [Synechococcales cyanobacterium C42_A2020_086]|jgi:PAS domain S-box-containing protein|nr:PAS domain S-box protein [Synechococcales cyanobacterium C42_A2020_086]